MLMWRQYISRAARSFYGGILFWGISFMKRTLPIGPLSLVLLVALFSGCGSREPLITLQKLIDTSNEISKDLESVHDAPSAMAVTTNLDHNFQLMNELVAKIPELERKYKDRKFPKITIENITRNSKNAEKRFTAQIERMRTLRGLPIEFWRVLRIRALETAHTSLSNAHAPELGQEAQVFLEDTIRSLKQHGHDKTILLEFTNLPFHLQEKMINHLQALAPDATIKVLSVPGITDILISPVDDYEAFRTALDLGTITFEDASQRRLEIQVDRRKLGARANSDEEEDRLVAEEERRKREEESKAFEEKQRKFQEQIAKKLEEQREPDSNDPEYYEKLAERMLSENVFIRGNALAALIKADPSQVESAETRKTIARNFRKLALDSQHHEQDKCIKGLVVWAGKYSVPVLIEMLENDMVSFGNRTLLYKTLGDLKDPRAVEPVAKRLTNFSDQRDAFECLRRIGPPSEDALLQAIPLFDYHTRIKLLEILADCGTSKSYRFLRQCQKDRNPQIRDLAKRTKNAIRKRLNDEKAD